MKYHLYGLVIETEFVFRSGLVEAPEASPVDVTISLSRDFAPLDGMPIRRRYETQALREGLPVFCVDEYADRMVLSFPNVIDYHVFGGRKIVAEVLTEVEDYLIEIHLLGIVSTFVLESRGTLALHASAAVVPSGAVAFLANNKGGKTSLAASFVQAGDALLTDDVLAVRIDGEQAIGASGYPCMRMWPEHAEVLLGRGKEFDRVRPDTEKRRIPLHTVGPGGFCVESRPIAAFFVPERHNDPDAAITVDRIPGAEAFKIILGNGYIATMAEDAGISGNRFTTIAQLVRIVPVYRLRYPNGREYLPLVREAIMSVEDA